MTGHVILCGLNELGCQTLEELHRLGEEVVVVARAPSEEFADRARALGATLVDGNYRHEQALRSARAARRGPATWLTGTVRTPSGHSGWPVSGFSTHPFKPAEAVSRIVLAAPTGCMEARRRGAGIARPLW